MIKTLAIALALTAAAPTAALSDPIKRLAEYYARERLCGIDTPPGIAYELVRQAEDKGMSYGEIRRDVVSAGTNRANEIEVSGKRNDFCRKRE